MTNSDCPPVGATPGCTCDGGSYEVKRHPFIVNADCLVHRPVGATDSPDERRSPHCHLCSACHPDWPCRRDCHICWPTTQPQPTDAIRELAENLRNSGREWVHTATLADNIIRVLDGFAAGFGSGPNYVGAVAEIRALHHSHRSVFSDTLRCRGCGFAYPCPTIAALDKAGCP